MADSGYAQLGSVQRGIDYLERALVDAATSTIAGSEPLPANRGSKGNETPTSTPGYPAPSYNATASSGELSTYALALVANAYVAAGEDATPLLDQLLERSSVDENNARFWQPGATTYYGGYGLASEIETTALATQALLRTAYAPAATDEAVAYIAANRDAYGSYYSTQATIQALKALILAAADVQEQGAATIAVTVKGSDGETATHTLTVDDANQDVMQQLVFDGIEADAEIAIVVDGERKLPFQLVTDYYQPWTSTAETAGEAPVRIDVRYDRTELAVNETVGVRWTVAAARPSPRCAISVCRSR